MLFMNILTCVYCGHEYPQETPSHGSQILTDHLKICEKHPLRKSEANVALLRNALVGLLGVDGENELKELEIGIRLASAPDADRTVALNAIHALLATINTDAS